MLHNVFSKVSKPTNTHPDTVLDSETTTSLPFLTLCKDWVFSQGRQTLITSLDLWRWGLHVETIHTCNAFSHNRQVSLPDACVSTKLSTLSLSTQKHWTQPCSLVLPTASCSNTQENCTTSLSCTSCTSMLLHFYTPQYSHTHMHVHPTVMHAPHEHRHT